MKQKARLFVNSILLPAAALVFSLYACSGTGPKVNGTSDTAALATGDTSAVKSPVYDPDPTDTIPGELYTSGTTSEQTADRVRQTLTSLFKDDLAKNLIDENSRKFIFFEYDLNGDSKNEILVGLTGPYFCGSGGCTQYVLDDQGNVVSTFTVAGYPVIIDNNKTKGWFDLFIYSGGKNRIVKFDGKKYPSNPSVQPALKEFPGDGLTRALNFVNEPYPWFRF
jgi:hypothetical protein